MHLLIFLFYFSFFGVLPPVCPGWILWADARRCALCSAKRSARCFVFTIQWFMQLVSLFVVLVWELTSSCLFVDIVKRTALFSFTVIAAVVVLFARELHDYNSWRSSTKRAIRLPLSGLHGGEHKHRIIITIATIIIIILYHQPIWMLCYLWAVDRKLTRKNRKVL